MRVPGGLVGIDNHDADTDKVVNCDRTARWTRIGFKALANKSRAL